MSCVSGGNSGVKCPSIIAVPVSGAAPVFVFKLDFSDARNSGYLILFGGFF